MKFVIHNNDSTIAKREKQYNQLNSELLIEKNKIDNLVRLKDNALQIGFLLFSLLLLGFFQYLGVALVIISYVFLSVINNAKAKKAIS